MIIRIVKAILINAIIFLLYSCGGILDTPIKEISLNYKWQVTSENGSIQFTTNIPNEVHLDLFKNKVIEHPFFGDNEKNIQWVAENNWIYEKEFDVDSSFLSNENLELVFGGIDTYSDVYLNEKLILQTDNQFRQWNVDVNSIIKTSNNKLKILIRSPFIIENKKAREYEFQPSSDSRVFTRKAAYVYGWDWGPRIVTSGIWKPVKLVGWNGPILKDVFIIQDSLTERKAYLTAKFEIYSTKPAEVTLFVYGNKQKLMTETGTQSIDVKLEIDYPDLWWPSGLGDQKLYKIDCSLIHNDFGVQTITKKIGLRTIDLVQEKDSLGKSFYFKVNSIPVFMKGANYIPIQILGNDVDTSKYVQLINDVVESNMNMLRVWGGGIYEHDIFYDLCDEKGILVWQDFMFANGMYPADSLMVENIKQEASDQIKRLRNHPSIALFCGNNEIAEAWANWGWKNKYSIDQQKKMENDYNKIFNKLLPEVVNQHTPQIAYWPSSPQFGRGDKRSQFEGDSHYWGVWHDEEPFEMYEQKVPRFMSEFGFQSYPSLKTLSNWLDEKDLDYDSQVLQNHQKHSKGNELIKKYMEWDYNVPENFSNFIYLSQLLQAEGIVRGIEAHRRAMPYCMGSLYWQLTDCWPVVSWSGIDYEGRWKAPQYFAKKSFEPIILSLERNDETLNIYLVNDKKEGIEGYLTFRLMNFNGKKTLQAEEYYKIKPNCVELLRSLDITKYAQVDLNAAVLNIGFDGNVKVSEKNFYFVKPKEMNLLKPEIKITIEKEENHFVLLLLSDVLAKNVFVDSDIDGSFSDNFFDLIPGEEKRIEFYPEEDIDEVSFTVFSLWDTLENSN
jgi:beta-mannosidase